MERRHLIDLALGTSLGSHGRLIHACLVSCNSFLPKLIRSPLTYCIFSRTPSLHTISSRGEDDGLAISKSLKMAAQIVCSDHFYQAPWTRSSLFSCKNGSHKLYQVHMWIKLSINKIGSWKLSTNTLIEATNSNCKIKILYMRPPKVDAKIDGCANCIKHTPLSLSLEKVIFGWLGIWVSRISWPSKYPHNYALCEESYSNCITTHYWFSLLNI